MANQVVKVKREAIVACITCPLCNNLLKQATTISECLHTYCRKCIYDKISDEELESCPVCNIDLGCVPLEKLRDGNLQVLFVQKYLMRKLDLSSESEVEVKCMGHPVVPTLDLHSLLELWLQTASTSERIPARLIRRGFHYGSLLC